MNLYWISLAILTTLTFGSCSPLPAATDDSPGSTPLAPPESLSHTPLSTSSAEPAIQEVETDTNPSLPIPARTNPQMLIEQARQDLAERLAISDTLIHLVEIDEVLWPDSSLGCSQAGNTYEQIPTPGYLVRLEYAGNAFEYHANIHGTFFYCEKPTPPISATPVDINP